MLESLSLFFSHSCLKSSSKDSTSGISRHSCFHTCTYLIFRLKQMFLRWSIHNNDIYRERYLLMIHVKYFLGHICIIHENVIVSVRSKKSIKTLKIKKIYFQSQLIIFLIRSKFKNIYRVTFILYSKSTATSTSVNNITVFNNNDYVCSSTKSKQRLQNNTFSLIKKKTILNKIYFSLK